MTRLPERQVAGVRPAERRASARGATAVPYPSDLPAAVAETLGVRPGPERTGRAR